MPLRFGEFRFDAGGRRLRRGGTNVALEPKVFALLELLLERRPAAVAKQEIHERLWPDTFVTDSSLTTLVRQLRRAIGTARVRTVRGFGYAFEGEAVPESGARAETPALFLAWKDAVLPLCEGENVVGRGPLATACVDAAGVSRRHAVVRVRGREAEVEDLDSKNGTFLRGVRLAGPAPLADRDEIGLGRTVLVFRCPAVPGRTKTERL